MHKKNDMILSCRFKNLFCILFMITFFTSRTIAATAVLVSIRCGFATSAGTSSTISDNAGTRPNKPDDNHQKYHP